MSNIMIPDGAGGFVEKPPAVVEALGKQIMTALNKHYPDWKDGWKVAIDTRGGIIQVRNMLISGKMGFVMKITAIDPEMRNVMRHAGELLERYRISREKNTDVIDVLHNMKRNYKGEATPDE